METEGSLLCTQETSTSPYREPVASTPQPPTPISLRSTLILSSHLSLFHPSGLFPPGFPTKIFYRFLISALRATRLAHLIFLDLLSLIIFVKAYKLWSSSLGSLLQHPTASPPYVEIFCSPTKKNAIKMYGRVEVPFYLWLKGSIYSLDSRVGGPQIRSERGGEEKNPCPCRKSKPGRPARSLVTILSEL
jgi:hypothetical protein